MFDIKFFAARSPLNAWQIKIEELLRLFESFYTVSSKQFHEKKTI